MVLDSLDVEAEGGADDAGVLPVDLEHDGRLPRVVQTPVANPHRITSAATKQCERPIERLRRPAARALDPIESKNRGERTHRASKRKWRAEGTYTMRMRISFSLRLIFLMMLSSPMISEGGKAAEQRRGQGERNGRTGESKAAASRAEQSRQTAE